MKALNSKLILGTLAGLLILGESLAVTSTASHSVSVTIPAVSELRLTLATSNTAVGSPTITFAPTAAQILSAADAATDIDPTTAPTFNRVSYFVNQDVSWSVAVKATGTPTFPSGLALADVKLLYSANDSDGNPAGGTTLNMSTLDQTLDSGIAQTGGYRHTSLAYQLHLDGNEAQGSSSGVVIQFTLTTP